MKRVDAAPRLVRRHLAAGTGLRPGEQRPQEVLPGVMVGLPGVLAVEREEPGAIPRRCNRSAAASSPRQVA